MLKGQKGKRHERDGSHGLLQAVGITSGVDECGIYWIGTLKRGQGTSYWERKGLIRSYLDSFKNLM